MIQREIETEGFKTSQSSKPADESCDVCTEYKAASDDLSAMLEELGLSNIFTEVTEGRRLEQGNQQDSVFDML